MHIDESNNKSNVLSQLRIDVRSIVEDINVNDSELSAYLHGSVLEAGWQPASDIDMLFLCQELTDDILVGLYSRIAGLTAFGSAVKVEKRVGPLIAEGDEMGSPAPVIVHAVIHDRRSWQSISPATQILLAMSAEPIIGHASISTTFRGLSPGNLAMKFSADLQYLRDIMQSGTLPFWQWSDDERPVQLRFRQKIETDEQRRKLLRYAAALLTGWIWILHDRKLDKLSGLSLEDLIQLAGDLSRAEDMASAAKSLLAV